MDVGLFLLSFFTDHGGDELPFDRHGEAQETEANGGPSLTLRLESCAPQIKLGVAGLHDTEAEGARSGRMKVHLLLEQQQTGHP